MYKSTESQFKEFLESPVWADLKDELRARYQVVLGRLVAGDDDQWSDDNMRGRLSEIDYILGIPEVLWQDLAFDESKKSEKEKKDEYGE